MRVVVIGGTGHVGSYLIPRLVNAGYDVISISRNKRSAYFTDDAWAHVESLELNRDQLDETGEFGNAVAEFNADIVIDLICFNLGSAKQLFEAVAGSVKHFLHCGTIWVYGASSGVPSEEYHERKPLGDYGRNKAEVESYLLAASTPRTAVTVLHPGHIVGPGWVPLNPAGNFNQSLFTRLTEGKGIVLPDSGLQTLHHVHADDVALAFQRAIEQNENSAGESFNIVSDAALTLNAYAEAIAKAYGQDAFVSHLPMNKWAEQVSTNDYEATLEHLLHSSNCSNQKARDQLGFTPRYSSIEAVIESIGTF